MYKRPDYSKVKSSKLKIRKMHKKSNIRRKEKDNLKKFVS